MIYGINERPPLTRLLVAALQLLMSIFVATALIASICGMDRGAGLAGAGIGSLLYSVITKGKSPMFISNSGAFVAPVLLAVASAGLFGVFVGGVVTCVVYCIFGLIFTRIPVENVYKAFPPALIGAVTIVIGINLMGFIPTYVGETGQWGVIVALITMLATALVAHYAHGSLKMFPFLVGILVGYGVSAALTLTGVAPILDLTAFQDMYLFNMPKFAFTQWHAVPFKDLVPIIVTYIAYTVSAMMECLSDHAALGGIVGVDLYKNPGLARIFIGEGVANLASSAIGGLGACSYGEGVACVGFSKIASVWVTRVAALMLIFLGFFGPVQAFIASVPACVFAGSAIVLYGFIAGSGVKMLQKIDLNNQKNLIIVSTVLSLGISGVVLGNETISLSATALALVVGVVLNVVLRGNGND